MDQLQSGIISSSNKRRSKRRRTRRAWSSITGDIVRIIAGKIVSGVDYASFCAVCRRWYSIASHHYSLNKPQFEPLLIAKRSSKSATLRNPSRNPRSDRHLKLHLPWDANSTLKWWGTPFGWFITHDHVNLKFSLVNPFTGANIPIIKLMGYRHSHRAFLTSNPDSDPENCLLIVSISRLNYQLGLAFIRPRRVAPRGWRYIEERGSEFVDLCGVTLFQGQLYGILKRQHPFQLVSFQLGHKEGPNGRLSNHLVKTLTLYAIPKPVGAYEKHIVDINGDLCVCMEHSFTDLRIDLYRIDLTERSVTRIVSLAGHSLFLGKHYAFACRGSYAQWAFFKMLRGGGRRLRRERRAALASNYVFYIRKNHRYSEDWDFDVWDVSGSKVVCREKNGTSFRQLLWIVPSLKFGKLLKGGGFKNLKTVARKKIRLPKY